MCGIVCYFGHSQGLDRVIEALSLLEYRAPDSSGVSLINEQGTFSLSRSVGTARQLIQHLIQNPLYQTFDHPSADAADFLSRQGLDLTEADLRSCSARDGYNMADLYQPGGFSIGLGDRGAPAYQYGQHLQDRFSAKVASILQDHDLSASPDLILDPVRHAFRLLGQHVASQIQVEPDLRSTLTTKMRNLFPGASYDDWTQAWLDELSWNIPGAAYTVAVRHFQETTAGLSSQIPDQDWGRIGDITARAMTQVVMGHGRWAMVGEVTAENTHPFLDRSQTRAVCENGSHNAKLLLDMRSEQERWWWERGVPEDEDVHRSENTTEVIAYEWERAYLQLTEGPLSSQDQKVLEKLRQADIQDRDEQALRLALSRLTEGNAHACSFHSLRHPGTLYISSHNKPIAIIKQGGSPQGPDPVMVASDINAGLMLWPGPVVDQAANRINQLRENMTRDGANQEQIQKEIQSILDRFKVEVIFLDRDLYGGEELLARLETRVREDEVEQIVDVTKYDGTPLEAEFQEMNLNPSMVGKGGYPSYTEFHIAEIPDVLDRIITRYVRADQIHLASHRKDLEIYSPGLNEAVLQDAFGPRLEQLQRIILIGEGSSFRDAQAVAPLFRHLLPDLNIVTFHPVEVLNLGEAVDPETDLVLEISWSGTTDSVLKTDGWLNEQGLMRLGVTGRPQSDLGRRTSASAGTLDVQSGEEISVATVKGFESILMTLYLIALRLTTLRGAFPKVDLQRLQNELIGDLPRHVRELVEDKNRRDRTRTIAQHCSEYNKVAVIGDSPICIEGELKIEELAQIVACPFAFNAESLRSLIERSAAVDRDRLRTLFVINATNPKAVEQVRPLLAYLQSLDVYAVIHTIDTEETREWGKLSHTDIILSPQVSGFFQPLIDALFYFDFAVALAYARGLSPQEVDRPRNLAKSVTTTGAEERTRVEDREEFHNITLEGFAQHRSSLPPGREGALPRHVEALPAIRGALSPLKDNSPLPLKFNPGDRVLLTAPGEAAAHAASMARAAWEELLGVDVEVVREAGSTSTTNQRRGITIHIQQSGAYPTLADTDTILLPGNYSSRELASLGSLFLIALAVRSARQSGKDVSVWERGLDVLPDLLSRLQRSESIEGKIRRILAPYVQQGYDKAQIIGGGQDHAAAQSIARSLRSRGFMAEALYTDSAWHGPLAAVGGPGADQDALAFILATDPLFQPAAMVDTQVYRTRHAPVILILPEGNQDLAVVQGVGASASLPVPQLPRPFTAIGNALVGDQIADVMHNVWSERDR